MPAVVAAVPDVQHSHDECLLQLGAGPKKLLGLKARLLLLGAVRVSDCSQLPCC